MTKEEFPELIITNPLSNEIHVWVCFINEDGTQRGLTTREIWDSQPHVRFDTEGQLMEVKLEFEADYFEARKRYLEWKI